MPVTPNFLTKTKDKTISTSKDKAETIVLALILPIAESRFP